MKPKIYISRPIGTSIYLMTDIIKKIHDLGAEAIYWIEGSYYKEDLIKSANAVVFISRIKEDDINFNESINSLTRGVNSELKIAIQYQIPIFKVYKTKTDDVVRIYKAETRETQFKGIAGTTDSLSMLIIDFKVNYKELPLPINPINNGNISGRWESNQPSVQQIPRIPTIEEVDKRILLLRK